MLVRCRDPGWLTVMSLRMITVDIQRFSNQLAEIYSNIAKPVLDVM